MYLDIVSLSAEGGTSFNSGSCSRILCISLICSGDNFASIAFMYSSLSSSATGIVTEAVSITGAAVRECAVRAIRLRFCSLQLGHAPQSRESCVVRLCVIASSCTTCSLW